MIVFDLDGTLVDSAEEIVGAMDRAWNAIVDSTVHGPFPRERFRIGPPLTDIVRELSPGLSAEERDALTTEFRALYDASDFSRTTPYAGVLEALGSLANRGERLCVATNKRRAPTLAIVARWFPECFAEIACIDGVWPDDGTRPGEKSAMLAWLMARVTGSGSRAIMIGDTPGDIMAARKVGVRAIAVTWGYERTSTLADSQPDALVDDVPSLLAAISSVRT
ncbi:MAG TPA: HAD family hydrolase [Labilithrix sp.]|nr:HAD family hydrolase [Labilithrix sp.]